MVSEGHSIEWRGFIMYIIMIKNIAKEGMETEYKNVSIQMMEDMKSLEGCIDARVLQSEENPNVIVDEIIWKSKDASKIDDGSIFMKYKPQLKPLFVSNTTETYYV